MEQFGMALRFVLPILAIVSVARALYVNRRHLNFIPLVWRRFTLKIFVEVFVLGTLTLLAIYLLDAYVPALGWGWPSLFGVAASNMAVSPVTEGTDSPNLMIRLLVPFFLAALLITLPLLAGAEERIFRKGRHSWREITIASIIFGLVHMVVGVPLCAGLVLIGPGFFYAIKYRSAYLVLREVMTEEEAQRGGWLVSTTYHSLYNTVLVVLLLIATITNI